MNGLRLAVLTDVSAGDHGLAAAIEREPRVVARHVTLGSELPPNVDGVVVDVPLAKRFHALSSLSGRMDLPILTETPFAPNLALGHTLAEQLSGHRVASLNPLAHHVSTMRLLEQVAEAADPLETFFAARRFRSLDRSDQHLAQIVGFANALTRSFPIRLSALRRSSPDVLIALLRYEGDVVGSLEIGGHLPNQGPRFSELLIECFCHASAYQCRAENQTITLEADSRTYLDWAETPAAAMLSTFIALIQDDRMPRRGVEDDLRTLAICAEISVAATERMVRRLADAVQSSAKGENC